MLDTSEIIGDALLASLDEPFVGRIDRLVAAIGPRAKGISVRSQVEATLVMLDQAGVKTPGWKNPASRREPVEVRGFGVIPKRTRACRKCEDGIRGGERCWYCNGTGRTEV